MRCVASKRGLHCTICNGTFSTSVCIVDCKLCTFFSRTFDDVRLCCTFCTKFAILNFPTKQWFAQCAAIGATFMVRIIAKNSRSFQLFKCRRIIFHGKLTSPILLQNVQWSANNNFHRKTLHNTNTPEQQIICYF